MVRCPPAARDNERGPLSAVVMVIDRAFKTEAAPDAPRPVRFFRTIQTRGVGTEHRNTPSHNLIGTDHATP